jgi:hypothetical protein
MTIWGANRTAIDRGTGDSARTTLEFEPGARWFHGVSLALLMALSACHSSAPDAKGDQQTETAGRQNGSTGPEATEPAQGSPTPDDIFQPRMLSVATSSNMDAVFAKARELSAAIPQRAHRTMS